MSKPLTFGSLFAGIGGIDLGLERAGLQCKWQVEIDPFARQVLEKHWPDVRRHDDVRTFPPKRGGWKVDLVAGGFPCQDISQAGRRRGLEGERSGLWSEYKRVIGEIRPKLVLIENVNALRWRGLGRVLEGLSALGYDAEWQVLSAAQFGAPHLRERVFILAHARGLRFPIGAIHDTSAKSTLFPETWNGSRFRPVLGDAHRSPRGRIRALPQRFIRGMADGVPSRMDLDRIRACGNAVVPQVAEWIGRRIVEAMRVGAAPAS